MLRLLVACGLALVWLAKIAQLPTAGQTINVNTVTSAQDLIPYLAIYADPAEREDAARENLRYRTHPPIPNVGALARIRVGARRLQLQK